jgi:DnaJ-class molecular chaperone
MQKLIRRKDMEDWINCPECDGEGQVERDVWVRQSSTWHGDFGSHMEDCDVCGGIGQIDPLEEDE